MNNKIKKEQELLEDMRQTYSMLFIAANKLQTEVDASLVDLTSRQLMLMTAIAHCEPTDASIMKISAILGSTKQNVTRMVQSLCKRGILVSEPSKTDKRSVNIQLTDLGKTLFEENVPKGNSYFLKIFRDFQPSEIAQFRAYLERLTDYDNNHQTHFEKVIQTENSSNHSQMEPLFEELHEKLIE